MPSIAANSSVTHSTPAARSPSTCPRCSAKWKTTSVVTLNSAIAGHGLRRAQLQAQLLAQHGADGPPHRYSAPMRAASISPAGASRSARPARRPSARSASASPPAGSWLVTTRVRPLRGADERLDELGRRGVEVGARLVEEQHLGVVQHGAADGQALDHAARVGVDLVVGARGQPDALEQLVDARSSATPCRRAWKRRFSRALRSR